MGGRCFKLLIFNILILGGEIGMRFPKLEGEYTFDMIAFLAPQIDSSSTPSTSSSVPTFGGPSVPFASVPSFGDGQTASHFCARMEESCRNSSFVILCCFNEDIESFKLFLLVFFFLFIPFLSFTESFFFKKNRNNMWGIELHPTEPLERPTSPIPHANTNFVQTTNQPFWAKSPITPNFALINIVTRESILLSSHSLSPPLSPFSFPVPLTPPCSLSETLGGDLGCFCSTDILCAEKEKSPFSEDSKEEVKMIMQQITTSFLRSGYVEKRRKKRK